MSEHREVSRIVTVAITAALAAIGATVLLVAEVPARPASAAPVSWELISATVSDESGDGLLAPGEGALVAFTIRNATGRDATSAHLEVAADGLEIVGTLAPLGPVPRDGVRQSDFLEVRRPAEGASPAWLDVTVDGQGSGTLLLPVPSTDDGP